MRSQNACWYLEGDSLQGQSEEAGGKTFIQAGERGMELPKRMKSTLTARGGCSAHIQSSSGNLSSGDGLNVFSYWKTRRFSVL